VCSPLLRFPGCLLIRSTDRFSFGNQPNIALVEHHKKILEENLKAFDQILATRKYMAGDNLTIVDFFYLPIGSFLVEVCPVSPHPLPRFFVVRHSAPMPRASVT
jgi:glutathione S-transferase